MTNEKRIRTSGNFVICDVQEEYAEYLLKILAEEYSGEYQFYLFQDPNNLKEFLEEEEADFILIAEEYEEELCGISDRGKFIILTEDPAGQKRQEGYVFRYQSAGNIVRDIRYLSGRKKAVTSEQAEDHKRADQEVPEQKKGGTQIRDKPDIRKQGTRGIIGIYSPVHRIGKTKFALRLGEKLAEKNSVLYINMEGYSGGNYYFSGDTENDLGDLLYCMKQEWTDYGLRISAMAGQIGNLDYILPMKNEQDLHSVNREEWMELLDTIIKKCIYETIILDLGDCIDGLYDILRKCSKIYMPYITEGAAEAKIEQYEKNLRMAGYGDILRKTVKKQMKKIKSQGKLPEKG